VVYPKFVSLASAAIADDRCLFGYASKDTQARSSMAYGFNYFLGTLLFCHNFSSEIAEKITGEEINSSSFSRYDRLSSIASGINMFLDHPLLGVGIQGYAFALPQYVDPFIQSF
jgi:hypothetical protein